MTKAREIAELGNVVTVDGSNIGIGGAPDTGRSLHVQGAGFQEVIVEKTDVTTSAILLAADTGIGSIYTRSTASDSTAIPLTFHTGNTEAMRIDSTGNVGIGTSLPSAPLHVAGDARIGAGTGDASLMGMVASGDNFNITTSSSVGTVSFDRNVGIGTVPLGYSGVLTALQIGGNANIAAETATGVGRFLHISQNANYDTDNSWEYISTDEASSYYQQGGQHVWRNAASGTSGTDISWSERMRIDSSGNVGIGTSSPSKTLDVDGQLRIRNGGATGYALLEYGASATATNNWHVGSEGDGTYRFYNGNFGAGSEKMRIDSSGLDVTGDFTATGDVTAYSDERLKSDIVTIPDALEKVKALRGVNFTKDGEASTGVIAQEVQQVIPEVVHENDEYLSVAYGNLVGVLIEAVKELSAEVEALKAR